MLTSPKIEKLAFEGRCRWSVQWFGIGTAGTVTVPAGGFAIVRQILYRPFFNPTSGRDAASEFVHQLTLTEQGSTDELQYIFRDSPTGAVNNYANLAPANSGEIIETWGIFKRNICIDIINAPRSTDFVYVAGAPFLPAAQEKNPPLGFGTTLPILPRVDFSLSEIYIPQGEARPATGVNYATIGTGVRDRLRFDVTTARSVQPIAPGNTAHDFEYPIIGLGMWIFNIPVSEYLNY